MPISRGNCRLQEASEKIFITDTTSGNVHVPQNAGEERFEVDTTSGDIEITLAD